MVVMKDLDKLTKVELQDLLRKAGLPVSGNKPDLIERLKKAGGKKSAARKSAARKSPAKKSAARKSAARKSAARKSAARKSAARKSAARKSSARKSAARKSAARKSAARKSVHSTKDGIHKVFYPGTKKLKEHYVIRGGKLAGTYFSYHRDGTMTNVGHYTKGVKTGLWFGHNTDGGFSYKARYDKNGAMISLNGKRVPKPKA